MVFAVSYAPSAPWISLKGKLTLESVQVNYVLMKTVIPDLSLDEHDLFDEFSCVQKHSEKKLEAWNEKMTKILLSSVVKCWLNLQRRT
jgi:hypothetical protein